MKQMAWDQQAFRVWDGKMNSHINSVQHQRAAWNRQVAERGLSAAKAFLQANAELEVIPEAKDGQSISMQLIKTHDAFKESIERRLQLEKGGLVQVLVTHTFGGCNAVKQHKLSFNVSCQQASR